MSNSESPLHFKLLRFEFSKLYFTSSFEIECLYLPSVAIAIADQTITYNCHRTTTWKITREVQILQAVLTSACRLRLRHARRAHNDCSLSSWQRETPPSARTQRRGPSTLQSSRLQRQSGWYYSSVQDRRSYAFRRHSYILKYNSELTFVTYLVSQSTLA